MPSTSDPVARLIAWVEADGGYVGPIRVAGEPGRRSASAAGDLVQGTPLLALPAACLITRAVAEGLPCGRALAARWRGEALDHVLLAAALVYLRRARPPRWVPWLDTLPTALPAHPLFFDDADLAALRGTTIELFLPGRRARLVEEHGWIREGVPGLEGLEVEEWLFARTLVNARVFALGALGEALAPFADLFDHDPDPEATWGMEGDRFVVRAARAVPAGAPVRDSYGAKPDWRLLFNYGFTLPDNPVEEAWIDLGPLGPVELVDDPTAPAVRETLALLGTRAADPEVRRRGWTVLGAACAERLGRLAEPDEAPATENARNAARVRATEWRVLGFWLRRALGEGG